MSNRVNNSIKLFYIILYRDIRGLNKLVVRYNFLLIYHHKSKRSIHYKSPLIVNQKYCHNQSKLSVMQESMKTYSEFNQCTYHYKIKHKSAHSK